MRELYEPKHSADMQPATFDKWDNMMSQLTGKLQPRYRPGGPIASPLGGRGGTERASRVGRVSR